MPCPPIPAHPFPSHPIPSHHFPVLDELEHGGSGAASMFDAASEEAEHEEWLSCRLGADDGEMHFRQALGIASLRRRIRPGLRVERCQVGPKAEFCPGGWGGGGEGGRGQRRWGGAGEGFGQRRKENDWLHCAHSP